MSLDTITAGIWLALCACFWLHANFVLDNAWNSFELLQRQGVVTGISWYRDAFVVYVVQMIRRMSCL